ncbi:O-antigen ligase family protein [Geomonas sp. Red69]|nr:O-antigen ligase family protein [Geomonas diazotrophica]
MMVLTSYNTGTTSVYGEEIYPRIGTPIVAFFCGYVLIWYLQIGYRIAALGAIRFEFWYAFVLGIVAVVFTPKIELNHKLVFYVLLYFLILLVQLPFSHDFNRSYDIFVDRILKFSALAFFIVCFVRSPRHLKFFLAAFLLACFKMGQEGLLGRVTGSLVWENQGIMRLHGTTPLYTHPNSLAGMALGTLPFVHFLWPLSNKKVKALLAVLYLFSLNIVLYTGSRTGYVGLIIFLLFVLFASENKKRVLLFTFAAMIICAPLVPADYYERFQSIFTQQEKEGHSAEARIMIIKDAVQVFAEHPLGIGISAFPKVRMEKFGRFQDTHNLYLEVATNLGIQGFIVFCLLLFSLFKTLRGIHVWAAANLHLLPDPSSQLYQDLMLIKQVALATSCFIAIRLALGMFGMDLYEIYWWFAIGVTIALANMARHLSAYDRVGIRY